MSAQTLLCFDFGTHRIGIAVGQTVTATASALPVIRAKDGDPNWQELTKLVKQWRPDAFVIGMPYNMDGSENEMTTRAKKFMDKLNTQYNIPCHSIDERLSTREAKDISRTNAGEIGKRFNEKTAVDSLAAQLILESWLEEYS